MRGRAGTSAPLMCGQDGEVKWVAEPGRLCDSTALPTVHPVCESDVSKV